MTEISPDPILAEQSVRFRIAAAAPHAVPGGMRL